MLVLTRKLQEELVVPQCELTFTILEVRGDKVRIGITAPHDVKVFRKEVLLRLSGNDPVEVGSARVACAVEKP